MFKRQAFIAAMTVAVAATMAGCATTTPAASSAAKTTLWKVTSAQRTLYLTGTTLPDYPLPQVMAHAFAQSGSVVFESDPGVDKAKVAALRPKIIAVVLKHGRLPAGQTLADKLTAGQLKRVKKALASDGVPFSRASHMRPWLVALTLQGRNEMATLKRVGAKKTDMLNPHLASKALARKIPIVALQPATDIMKMLAGFPQKLQVGWLMIQADAALKPFNAKKMKQTKQAWRTGDTAYLAKQVAKEFKGKPALYQAAVTNRNRTWVNKLEAMLAKSGKPVFVSVGSGHLVGAGNMRAMFRKDGYAITQL